MFRWQVYNLVHTLLYLINIGTVYRYQRSLAQRPILTQGLTTACLFTIGDTLAQQGVERKGLIHHDLARTARMTFYGGAIFAPVATKWFQFLQNRITLSTMPRTLCARVVADQTLCAPTMIGVFLSSMALMEGKSPQEKLQKAYWDALRANWMVWPFVQGVNFWMVPLQYRVLVVNVLNIGWNGFLSVLNSAGELEGDRVGA